MNNNDNMRISLGPSVRNVSSNIYLWFWQMKKCEAIIDKLEIHQIRENYNMIKYNPNFIEVKML